MSDLSHDDFGCIDEAPLRFGKYKGLTPQEVAVHEPAYILWLWENVHPSVCSEELYEACCKDFCDASEDDIY